MLVTVIGLSWGVKCSFDALSGEQDAQVKFGNIYGSRKRKVKENRQVYCI